MNQREEIEFKTLDGLTLRGTLYPSPRRHHDTRSKPFRHGICQFFQEAGINVLIYDPRTIDPAQQMRNYHDALTFLKADARIDHKRIALWGFSFSGAVALAAGALDKLAALVLTICPLTIWELSPSRMRSVMAKVMLDRESQLKGNRPFSIPMVAGHDELRLINESKEIIPDFEVTTTFQTYYNIMAWSPFETLRHLGPTPVLLVTPEDDRISPSQKQRS
ncbi:Alpha/Beta hydrolase protein [Stachybotrys elegans]|uniref:Alpha/Beta hydrolase protein n=1 Tax=Stachybotrys elegans TaxID=80388 RepID=A0A8K0SDC7_9HYPO|nr:Alpha/Beta hydrolase protein [Stachybotrys elegans]